MPSEIIICHPNGNIFFRTTFVATKHTISIKVQRHVHSSAEMFLCFLSEANFPHFYRLCGAALHRSLSGECTVHTTDPALHKVAAPAIAPGIDPNRLKKSSILHSPPLSIVPCSEFEMFQL